MPEIARDVALILRLYNRCMTFRVLPDPGGALDQRAWLMDLFDVIDEQKGEQSRREHERAERERTVRELKEKGRGRK